MAKPKAVVILLWVNLLTLNLPQVVKAGGEVKSSGDVQNEDGVDSAVTPNGDAIHSGPTSEDSQASANPLREPDDGSSFSAGEEFQGFQFLLEKIIHTPDGDEDVILIWKIENGQLRPTDQMDYRAFESDETYVVIHVRRDLALMQKNGEDEELPLNVYSMETGRYQLANFSSIYYWIGKNSALENISGAAFHAVSMDASIHETVNLNREAEGHESSSFKAAFERNAVTRLPETSIPDNIDENTKLMFLVREDYMARFTQVNSSLKRFVFEKDVCIVLNSAVVYTYCGHSASNGLKKLARHVAKRLLQARGSEVKEIVIYRTSKSSSEFSSEERQILYQFFAEFTPMSETAAIFDHQLSLNDKRRKRTEEEDLPIVRFYMVDQQNVMEEQIDNKSMALQISSFKAEECYVVDIGRNVGFFVWIGKYSDHKIREASARRAEFLLKKRGYSYKTPILYADERKVNISPAVYLSDLIALLKNVKLPITWILMPDEESIARTSSEFRDDAAESSSSMEPKTTITEQS